MNIHLRLPWPHRSPVRPARRRVAPDWVNARVDTAPAEEQPDPRGCGWFNSSHELHSGLLVTEHLEPERVANEVPLGWWLDWQTRPAGPSVPSVPSVPGAI